MTAKPIAIHLKPAFKRSGGPGDRVEYVAVLRSHDSRGDAPETFTVTGGFLQEDARGLTVELSAKTIQLKAQATVRYSLWVLVGDDAVPGHEVDLFIGLTRKGETTTVLDRRYFTVSGGSSRPR